MQRASFFIIINEVSVLVRHAERSTGDTGNRIAILFVSKHCCLFISILLYPSLMSFFLPYASPFPFSCFL